MTLNSSFWAVEKYLEDCQPPVDHVPHLEDSVKRYVVPLVVLTSAVTGANKADTVTLTGAPDS